MAMYRQGDVLLVRVETTPSQGEEPRDGQGRIVLAEGEATGHAHAIHHSGARLVGSRLDERFLEVLAEGGVDLVHEEHATIHLPSGSYQVILQREWRYPSPGIRAAQPEWVRD